MQNKDLKHIADKEPFHVPSAYFETLTDQIMNSLPDKEIREEIADVSFWQKTKPLVYLAAMFIGAALIIRIMMPLANSKNDLAAEIDIETVSDEFIQEAIDGAMLDDYLMYVYLTNNED